MILKTKIITVIILVLLLVVGASTAVVLKLQENRFMEHALHEARLINNLFVQSIKDSMQEGRTEDVQKIISNISDNTEITTLRILSADGEILKSRDPDEFGSRSLLFVRSALSGTDSASFVKDDQIISYRIIRNEPQCYGCHDSRLDINGIVEVGLSIKRHKQDVAAIRRFLIFSGAFTVVIIALILSVLFTSRVIKPLNRLVHTIREVERGDWDARVSVDSDDEIGVIGTSFNKMLAEIKSLYDKNIRKEREISRIKSELDNKRRLEHLNSQLEFKIRELEAANRSIITLSGEVREKNKQLGTMVERLKMINEVGRVLSSVIQKDEIVRLIIKTSAEVLNARQGIIHIDSSGRSALTLHYRQGVGVEKLSDLSLEFKDSYARLLKDGKPMVIRREGGTSSKNAVAAKAIGVPLRMKGEIVGAMLVEEKMDGSPFTDDEIELLSTLSRQAMVAIENAWLYERLKFNYLSTIQSLVNALEASDPYTKGHSERVRYLSVQIADYIGLEQKEIDALEHAAILHDIGKIGIDSSLLNKEGELTKDELQQIKTHPVIGEEILGPIETLSGVRTTVLQHHERYDGYGYPFGLMGEEISLKARILAVADTFDAMITNRPYREAMTFDRVIDELKREAGAQFDPYIVDAFVNLLNERGRELLSEVGYSIKTEATN